MSHLFRIDVGVEVKDHVTGFTGIVIGRANYLSGCDVYLVQPKLGVDGKMVDGIWFDDPRLYVVQEDKKPIVIDDRSGRTGADGVAPMK